MIKQVTQIEIFMYYNSRIKFLQSFLNPLHCFIAESRQLANGPPYVKWSPLPIDQTMHQRLNQRVAGLEGI